MIFIYSLDINLVMHLGGFEYLHALMIIIIDGVYLATVLCCSDHRGISETV